MTPQHTHEPELHCPACIDQLTRFQTGLLPQSDTEVVREHLNSCPDCRLFADQVETVADLATAPALRGAHNAQNAAAAFAACDALGLSREEIQAGFDSFPGLAHRMEQVARAGHVLFVNDSKATNADAAAMALASFSRIYWIAGGLAKEGGIEPLAKFFPKIARAYLVGEAAPLFSATLGGRVPYEISGTIASAVEHAARDAAQDTVSEEAVVLLSPACASFDQFANFEKRGDAFRAAVMALEGVSPAMERA